MGTINTSRPLSATLVGGTRVQYTPEIAGEGGMKVVHFTPDRSAVVCFFKDKTTSADPQRRARLEAIVGKYNPTADAQTGDYWRNLFCWPTGVVVSPELGVVAPAYPANFFFESGPFQGKEKQANWFTSPKLRKLLPEFERGTWLSFLQIGIRLSRALRRMHNAGLAHSDLSNKNVLVDPTTGSAVVIDIDSLVVPQLYPPDVLGTPGYIAPEVLQTQELELTDARRVLPSRRTDQHALAVLLYEYLLGRHPLRGPKVNSTASSEEDERLSMGERALWIENPNDGSNRPANISTPYTACGPYLSALFERAFTAGLGSPDERPGADEWERALVKTTDLLLPCPNASCPGKWFVFDLASRQCPWCSTPIRDVVPVLHFYREGRVGQFSNERHYLTVWHHQRLYKWHAFDNAFAGENADRTPRAFFALQDGAWWLVNQSAELLREVDGRAIGNGEALPLRDGMRLRLAQSERGRFAVVQMSGA